MKHNSGHEPPKRISEELIRKVVDFYLAMERPSYVKALEHGGYAHTTAVAGASKWFKRPEVVRVLDARREALKEQSGVTPEMLIEKLKSVAFGNLSKYIKVEHGDLSYDFTGASPADLRIIESMSVDKYMQGRGPQAIPVKKFKFTTGDPLRAIELLGRLLGAFKDKMEHSGEISLIERLQRGRERATAKGNTAKGDGAESDDD